MKNAILRFLMSKKGIWLTPLVATFVSFVSVSVAKWNGDLAATIDQGTLTEWLVAAIGIIIMALVNGPALTKAGDGIELAQIAEGLKPDRVAGPKFKAKFESKIASSDPLQHAFGNPDKPTPPRPARKKVGWWKR